MGKKSDTQKQVKQYFRVKSRQLAASAELPVCEHRGLIGSHREELHRIYLREVLPKRYEIGRGMVYGPEHRSHEADIVIWDSQNYPCLPMLDHSFFFAESVRIVLESKSLWTDKEFRDVLKKCRSVRDILTMPGLSLADQLAILKNDIAAISMGASQAVTLVFPYQIGTAAIFLKGGNSLNQDYLSDDLIKKVDDCWPDLVLLLEQGRVIIKNYQRSESSPVGAEGWLEFYDLGEDALLAFTVGLFAFLTERSTQTEVPLDILSYVPDLISTDPKSQVDFPLTRPMPQRTHLWRSMQNGQDQMMVVKE